MVKEILIIIPCFNEAARLRRENFLPLLGRSDLELLFVDDGSTDGTGHFIEKNFADVADSVRVQRLDRNRGKAEAVREGLRSGIARRFRYMGYMDADMSVSAGEMLRLSQIIRDENLKMVLGSRVALLGAQISRKLFRHYVGRAFATLAAFGLDLTVYDTQCGAKIIERCPALEDAVNRPFTSTWAFDVELIGRLLTPVTPGVEPLNVAQMREVPIVGWRDVPGSKLRFFSMLLAGLDLLWISFALRKRRRHRRRPSRG